MHSDKYFIEETLKIANAIGLKDEVPVAALVVVDGKIIGKGNNQVEMLQDPTAHAEMIAITAACHYIGSKYLSQATLYVSLEPCAMCKAAIAHAQIKRVVFATKDTSSNKNNTEYILLDDASIQQDASQMVSQFFKQKRKNKF
ncbi:MAG: nucleoside deaminase [Sphingobacteriales bacterium]|nr:MAG: nucleoside deaminase [Sphingobacteriales bacterium]